MTEARSTWGILKICSGRHTIPLIFRSLRPGSDDDLLEHLA